MAEAGEASPEAEEEGDLADLEAAASEAAAQVGAGEMGQTDEETK